MDAPLLSRREWLSTSGAVLAGAALRIPSSRAHITLDDLVQNPRGGYRFLPGVPFLSFGVVADNGFEIARTTFRQARPFPAGLGDIAALLQIAGRPIHALCGLELRSPRPLSQAEFNSFNQAYVSQLRRAGLLVDGQVPITRTNVAFTGTKSDEPELSIHAFSYATPTARREREPAPSFVLAGMPEIRNLQRAASGEPVDIVARYDTTPAGLPTASALRLKTEFILRAVDETMRTCGVQWTDVTGVQLYTVHDVQPLVASLILPRIGAAARLGIEWHHTYPPGIQVEIGVRGVSREVIA